MICEKCWADSYDPYKEHAIAYDKLLESRKENPCSPKEQAGQYWNEEKQIDERFLNKEPSEGR